MELNGNLQEENGNVIETEELLIWMFERDVFGMDDGEGRDIVIVASDGSEHVAHTHHNRLYLLFREMALLGEMPEFSFEDQNFHFWEDGPTLQALLSFLKTNDKAVLDSSFEVIFNLLVFGNYYKLMELYHAAIQVLKEKVDASEFKSAESLWTLQSWIVSQTNIGNGQIPNELMELKAATAKVFRMLVIKSRKQPIRSPAFGQNIFQTYWQMNVNFIF